MSKNLIGLCCQSHLDTGRRAAPLLLVAILLRTFALAFEMNLTEAIHLRRARRNEKRPCYASGRWRSRPSRWVALTT